MSTVDLSQLSESELEQALAKKRQNEKAKREKERKEYESARDRFILESTGLALAINKDLIDFKLRLAEIMDQQEQKLQEYGGLRSTSKGGFSIQDSDGQFKVKRIRSTEPTWDERSSKAITLIKEFLADTVKKKDKDIYEVLLSFIARNENGDLEYQKVMDLLQHENRWDDPRWLEGLKLIKESYSVTLRSYQFLIYQKDDQGKWRLINLNFSAV